MDQLCGYQKDLNQLRDLRKQLKEACKFSKEELDGCKVRMKAKEEDAGVQTDSSGEDGMSRGDAAFNKGAIKGIGLALKEAPKNFIEGFADLLLNPVSTVEGIIGFLETLPEMPGHIFEYLETIEGDEEAKGEEIAKFITEQLLTLASPNKVKLLQQVSKTKLGIAAVKLGQKANFKAFPDLIRVKGKTYIKGTNKIRDRFLDKAGNVYEKDYRHETLEMYNKRGKHLGEFCPDTGKQLKPAHPTRKIDV